MATIAPGTKKFAKRQAPKQAAKRTDEDTVIDNATGEVSSEDAQRAAYIDALTDLANNRLREAIAARAASGIEDEWAEADDLFNGFDELNQPTRGMRIRDKTPGPTKDGARPPGSTLLLNITKPKTRVAASRAKEMLIPTNDKPFDVKTTPVPEIEAVKTDPKLAGEMVSLADGRQAPALAVADMMAKKAGAAAAKESDWINDRFVEGQVYGEMRTVIDDASQRGTGCLKGPFPVEKVIRRWKKNEAGVNVLSIERKMVPTSKRIRIQDCFPAANCGDNIHNGECFGERDFMTTRQLRELARDPSYNVPAIADAIIEGPKTYAMMMSEGRRSRVMPGDTVSESALFEVFYLYTDVPADCLIAMGCKDSLLGNAPTAADQEPGEVVPSDEDMDPEVDDQRPEKAELDLNGEVAKKYLSREQRAALTMMPAIVTMVNGKAIKAVLAPQSKGEFPYDFFRWEKVDGQPWGRGVPSQMRAAQIIVKQGVRRMLENGGLSAGPQIAISSNLTPVDGKYVINGRKLWRFVPDELIKDIRAAMAFFTVPSTQQELMAIIEFGLRMADFLTNLPMLMQGDQQPGVAPETLGGLKMFESNALSPMRDIAKGHDDDIIIPHLGRYHDYYLEHEPGSDGSDTSIQALGSTALIQREEGRQFLMQLWPVKSDPDLRINPAKLAKETARANGYDMSLIQYTDDEWKQIQAEKDKQPPPSDPTIEAAKIRAASAKEVASIREEGAKRAEAWKAQQADADRALDKLLAKFTNDAEMMKLARDANISLENIKATLAAKAADIRSRRDEMQVKLSPSNPTHEGI